MSCPKKLINYGLGTKIVHVYTYLFLLVFVAFVVVVTLPQGTGLVRVLEIKFNTMQVIFCGGFSFLFYGSVIIKTSFKRLFCHGCIRPDGSVEWYLDISGVI